ncbi:SAV_2336 N-terminal domain-related protein [Streptomyces sp. NPDC127197]|uniref:SAV_2336 N-terminal domain-related protein n=1 Tax=Streptomyces sp. NPDC127197 TaxID=3345388 RepID=UPI00363A0B0C
MSAPAPGTPAGAVSEVLTALVARLRDAGLAPDVEELADALWLARRLSAPARQEPDRTTPTAPGTPHGPADGLPSLPTAPPTSAGPPEEQRPDSVRMFAPGSGSDERGDETGGRMTPVRVPAAPALPEPLALQRGLRPLQRYRAPVRPVPRTLDERATAEQAAESGLVLPVLRTERRREARLLLLMDVSTSTVVWQQALDELRQVCERAGAFREVQVQYLHEDTHGRPGCAATPEHTGPLHAPGQLSDPTGRRLTLVLSDCAGPMWRSGRIQRLLHGWAATAPVAVVQPLPQRMWLRTHLPARRGLLRRREGPAGTLEFLPDKGPVERQALPVPVLALRRGSVEGWARLVSGATGGSLATAAGWVRADHAPSRARVRAQEDLSGTERVRAFWRSASPEARRLAVYLSAVPLYLPVMQLVQHAMLAGSGPEVLSEVLLSGLLRRREDPDDPQAVRYEFLPGVAGELRTRLAVEDVELLFKHCSAYVERKFGRSVRNFPALAAAFLRGAVDPGAADASPPAGPGAEEPAGLRAFAEVSADVLRELGARIPVAAVLPELSAQELVGKGREAIGRFEGEGLTRELDAAVRYLQQAVEVSRTGAERESASVELADALLMRWRVKGVGEDLRDAWEAVGEPEEVGPRGRLVRGLVCWVLAGELSSRGLDFEGIPDSLRDWTRRTAHGTEAAALAVLLYLADRDLGLAMRDQADTPDAMVASETLMHVRRAIAEAGREHAGAGPYQAVDPGHWYPAHLQRAVSAADIRISYPEWEHALLVRGGLWLDLARHHAGTETPVPKRAAESVRQAREDFLAALMGEPVLSDVERCRAWLAVASATELAGSVSGAVEVGPLVEAWQEALAAAGNDEALRLECLLLIARMSWSGYQNARDERQLDSAIEAWTQAERLLGEDHPDRPDMLAAFGAALLEKARLQDAIDTASRAVVVLRAALQETPMAHPDIPVRWMNLSLAHFRRYELQEVLSDLYEAEWLLGEAIRCADQPEFLVRCWTTRGAMLTSLYSRTATLTHLHRAIECYGQAVELAREEGMDELLATALLSREQLREQLRTMRSGPARTPTTRPDPETAPE